MTKFETALQTVFKHEGAFVDHPQDPGGATHYGVSLRWLKSLGDSNADGILDGDFTEDGNVDVADIKAMTKEQAQTLYQTQWWDKYGYEKIEDVTLATKVFDFAINMGAKQAHKCLQRALRAAAGAIVNDDGILGPLTLTAINQINPDLLLVALRSEAAGFYRSLNKHEFIKGWLNRAYA